MNPDPLEDLLVDAVSVERVRMANALRNLVGVDNETGRIVAQSEFGALSLREKLAAFLVGKKAACMLGRADSEDASLEEIATAVTSSPDAVHAELEQLRLQACISPVNDDDYSVPDNQLTSALELLEECRSRLSIARAVLPENQ